MERLLQVLIDLRSNDNGTRSSAETLLQSSLEQSPDDFVLALTSIFSSGESATKPLRTSALVILRRILFNPVKKQEVNPTQRVVFDLISDQTRNFFQQSLLAALEHANKQGRDQYERSTLADTVAIVEKQCKDRNLTWSSLPAILAILHSSAASADRVAVYKIYAESPQSLPTPQSQILIQGLKDPVAAVKLGALDAAVNVLLAVVEDDANNLTRFSDVVQPMLEILVSISSLPLASELSTALQSIIQLVENQPKIVSRLLKTHLSDLVNFCLNVASPTDKYSCSKNHVKNPSAPGSPTCWTNEVRCAAVELLITLSDTSPSLALSHPFFLPKTFSLFLELMTERPETLTTWLETKGFSDDDYEEEDGSEPMFSMGEEGIDRVSRGVGEGVWPIYAKVVSSGKFVRSESWERRYTVLSSFAAVCEGCPEGFEKNLDWILSVIVPSLSDPHPIVQHSAVYAVGQISIDLAPTLQQSKYALPLLQKFTDLLALTATAYRNRGYLCAGLVNFFMSIEDCDLLGVEGKVDQKGEIVNGVFNALLEVVRGGGWIIGEAFQAIGALASCLRADFAPFYPSIVPLLLEGLEKPREKPKEANADDEEDELGSKALDCVTSICTAVPPSTFAPDAPRLLALLHSLYMSSATDPPRSLLTAYAQLSSIVPPQSFLPYLQDVFPHLLEKASRPLDMVIGTENSSQDETEEQWETLRVNGDYVSIRSEALEDKNEASGALVVLVQSCGPEIGEEFLRKVLAAGITLLKFYFHLTVRENAAALVDVTVKAMNKLPHFTAQDRTALLQQVTESFTESIAADKDPVILSSFLHHWCESFTALASPGLVALEMETRDRLIKSIEAQLTTLARKEGKAAKDSIDQDDDDEENWEEDEESDEDELDEAALFSSINEALHVLLKEYGAAFPVQPFVPFLPLINNGGKLAGVHFAMRLTCDIIQLYGEGSLQWIGVVLPTILNLISTPDPITRKIAAFITGVAAESAPNTYADFAMAAIEPLFNSVGPIDMSDPVELAARDNTISALSKIIRYLGDRLDSNTLLPRWVLALPIFEDADEMTPVYSLLLELIARGHPSVSPTTDVSQHVIKVLLSALENEHLPPSLHRPIAQALKTYLSSVPGGESIEIPAHVQAKVVALLE